MFRNDFQRLPGSVYPICKPPVAMLTSGMGMFSVCMEVVRQPADQVGCTDNSNGLLMDLERAIIFRGANALGLTLAAMWIGLW